MPDQDAPITIAGLLARELELLSKSDPLIPPDLPPVDLRTLLGEMAALKNEVRVETTAVRELREQSAASLAGIRKELAAAEQIRASERRRSALALIDVADRLTSTLTATRRAGKRTRSWWPFGSGADPASEALVKGLELTLGRVESHLSSLDVRRIPAVGRAFDPHVMEAVDTASQPETPEGEVLDEVITGYIMDADVLRLAQVVVNRNPGSRAPARTLPHHPHHHPQEGS